jgi:signal transduction histidine kinase
MTDASYFQESTELINELFPLGTVSAIQSTETLESYLDELVKQRTHELEQIAIRAQEMESLKSLFIATIGHELRTPLTSILGFTEILMSGYSGNINEKQYEQLNTVYRSGEYLLNLINKVLDISKIEAGKFEVNPEEFNINEIINDVVQTLSTVFTQKNIILKMDLISNIIIYSDKERYKQILFNLVGNALKFTHKNGEILIKTRIMNKSKVDVHIIDNGIGISKEDMHKLFKPFQQIDSSISKCYEGTGLGLYLTKNLVNILGGEISVQSEKGKGSDFNFSIPIKMITPNIS